MLELNERTRIDDLDTVIEQMQQLRDLGVRLAVDNFGEGFASLQYVRQLPVDVVKVAPSFVAGVCGGGEAAALVSATLELASILELEAIATGIETPAQAEALRGMGCRLGQGPLFLHAAEPVRSTRSRPAAQPRPVEPPLSIEPVLGWRVWRLYESDANVSLGSMTRQDLWPPGEPFRARCSLASHAGRVPSESCGCGIYAASTPEALARAAVLSGSVGVVGAIAMWGTVIEHDRGARAQLAYPARLRLVCSVCLGEGRGAVDPSVVVGSSTSLSPLCSRHAIGHVGPRKPAADVQADLLSSYAVDLLPIEHVSTALRFPTLRRDPREVADQVAEAAVETLKFVLNALLFLWTISGFLFLAFWIVAILAGMFLPDS